MQMETALVGSKAVAMYEHETRDMSMKVHCSAICPVQTQGRHMQEQAYNTQNCLMNDATYKHVPMESSGKCTRRVAIKLGPLGMCTRHSQEGKSPQDCKNRHH